MVIISAVNYTQTEDISNSIADLETQVVEIGEEWEFQIPNVQNSQGVELQFEIDLQKASKFTHYNQATNTFSIQKGITTKDDAGIYQIFITTVDEYGLKSDPSVLTLELMAEDEEATQEVLEIKNEVYAAALLEATALREKYKDANFEKPTVALKQITMLGKI